MSVRSHVSRKSVAKIFSVSLKQFCRRVYKTDRKKFSLKIWDLHMTQITSLDTFSFANEDLVVQSYFEKYRIRKTDRLTQNSFTWRVVRKVHCGLKPYQCRVIGSDCNFTWLLAIWNILFTSRWLVFPIGGVFTGANLLRNRCLLAICNGVCYLKAHLTDLEI